MDKRQYTKKTYDRQSFAAWRIEFLALRMPTRDLCRLSILIKIQ
jgi:hypothetical protein